METKLLAFVVSFVVLVLGCERTTGDQYNPHVYPDKGPFFEGWYIRFIDFQRHSSFGCLWGRVLPEDQQKANNLAFVGLIAAFDNQTKLQQFNSFPAVADVKVVVNGGDAVTQNPSPSTPTNFTFTDGGATKIKIDDAGASISCDAGGAHLEARLGRPASWGGRGPMGVLDLLPGMPLFWFVHSLHSPIIEYKLTQKQSGKVLMQGKDGYAHMEKNWGRSFPQGWIWIEGIEPESKASLAITYGPVGFGPVNIPGHLIGYRDPMSKYSVDFRPSNSFATVEHDACNGRLNMSVKMLVPPFYKMTLSIRAPLTTFSDRLFGPMNNGFRPVCQESFAATAQVKLFSWTGSLVSEKSFKMAALEFGGKFMCWGA